MMQSLVSAIVLAAGMSKRMGTLKQLLKFGERSLLETTLDALKEANVGEIIVVLGYKADTIRETMKFDSATKIVLNLSYAEGMSNSIKAGLGAVSSDSNAALIVLADQPLLSAAVINQLIEEYEKTQAAIVLPVYKGFRGNPVLIARSLFPEMMQISGDIGCRSIFGLHPEEIHKVPVNEIGILVDIDTAEDIEKLRSLELTSLQLEDRAVESIENRHLLIIGKEDVGVAIAKLGKFLKFAVIVVDPLLSKKDLVEADSVLNELNLQTANINEHTFVVIASRGRFDEEALEQALKTPAPYVALIGSKRRGAELLQRLRSNGISEEALSRVRCPAGLDIHASSPEEIALSVMAEIVSFHRK
jgi:molybdenum cofactor cytidylyltransferase